MYVNSPFAYGYRIIPVPTEMPLSKKKFFFFECNDKDLFLDSEFSFTDLCTDPYANTTLSFTVDL